MAKIEIGDRVMTFNDISVNGEVVVKKETIGAVRDIVRDWVMIKFLRPNYPVWVRMETLGLAHKFDPMKPWFQRVLEESDAMGIERGTFSGAPKEIAEAMYRNVMASNRTKGTKFQSAMSMLNYYINRAGRRLSTQQRLHCELAKDELRILFGKPTVGETGTIRRLKETLSYKK